MSEPTSAAKSGSQGFKRLEALELLPLPICRRSDSVVDVEHASDYEFSAWLRWNGVPFTGEAEWTFDSKCAVINYAASHGLKLRLIAAPENSLGIVSELFTWPEQPPEGGAS